MIQLLRDCPCKNREIPITWVAQHIPPLNILFRYKFYIARVSNSMKIFLKLTMDGLENYLKALQQSNQFSNKIKTYITF